MRSSSLVHNLLITTLVVTLFGALGVRAQVGTTSLRGTVTDKTGAAIVGAKVTLISSAQALQRESQTGSTGEYEFLALPPGNYALTVEMTSFRKYEQKNIQLLVNLPATVNAVLEVGITSQTIEVSAAAVTLNTTDASLGNAFNESQVKELPLEGRNVPDLLSLQPGVAFPNNRDDIPTWDTRKGAVNGARSDQSNVTVDGVPVNDEGGHAFTSVLPVTLDSVQEFRVTTSNYNADQGSTSGGQVAMVTKSGTNDIHGSAYEYNRNAYTEANDFFIKNAQQASCLAKGYNNLGSYACNKAPKLNRNIFGGSLGGPIKRDRMYLFMNYEGTRRAEATSETVAVPSAAMKDGVIQYACADPTQCPGLSVQAPNFNKPSQMDTFTIPAGYNALTPTQIAKMDPLSVGPSQVMLKYFNTFPAANCNNAGDGYNYSCFNWSAPILDTKNEYISKLDYNVTRDAKHRLSLTGAMRNESNPGTPFLPGQAASQTLLNFNKGLIASYNGVLTNSIVNNLRYGYIRESVGVVGNSSLDWNYFRGLNDQPGAVTRTNSFQRPIHNLADDLSWIKGKHTWQFGTQLTFIRTPSISYLTSFSDGSANASWTTLSGYAQKKSPLNPAYTCANSSPSSCAANGTPFVDPSFANSYDFPLQALLGMITEVDARYNFNRDGSALGDGAALKRRFAINGYELYAQDIWKISPTFTMTLGVRWSLFAPPWETNKLQVQPTTNLDTWFQNRAKEGLSGIGSWNDPAVAFDWSGPANGRPGFYNWDKKDFGPRVALAWAPRKSGGLLGTLLGEGKTSIRAGFGMVYDRFGQGIADDFSRYGSFGLSTELTNPAGFLSPYNAPRLTDLHTIPTTDLNGNQIFLSAPAAKFPQTFPNGTFYIGSSLDSAAKTPYAYTLDLSVGRELAGGFSLEVAYVGRLAHRLLTQLDVATPLDLKDPKSGLDYFTALTALAKIYRTGVSTDSFNSSMVPANVAQYWADVLSPPQPGDMYATGACGNNPTTVPVVAIYDLFCGNNLNETTGLLVLDYFGLSGTQICGTAPNTFPCNSYFPSAGVSPNNSYLNQNGVGAYAFYNPQFATLYAWKTMGTSNYNAMQVDLKHKMIHGVQFDLTYTFSKSIDLSSDAERVGTIGGTGAQIINAWSPFQFRGVSDFDTTHQITANWVADLPFGRNQLIGRNTSRFLDAVIGGWQLSGIGRWTSGFPFSVTNGYQWPTDWDLSGNGIKTGSLRTGTYYDPNNQGAVNIFSSFSAAANSFREPFPGEAGQRNILRGPGFFSVDAGLAKRWKMPWKESHSLQLRWQVYNVSNSKRFDPLSVNAALDVYGSTFGDYTRLSTKPRVMEFALRYEF